ncbi:hypothetical protein HPB50_013679 [Hyalomma asiaticum]|uniref:Uncharacterized protein n=1 Tax=Hyalomma asiaticum TaxID=266040 RepID=A0ACB7TJS5_HYAAI|nr:hypothetical protein HPB50_013679 [Hyalomma asiaticum]
MGFETEQSFLVTLWEILVRRATCLRRGASFPAAWPTTDPGDVAPSRPDLFFRRLPRPPPAPLFRRPPLPRPREENTGNGWGTPLPDYTTVYKRGAYVVVLEASDRGRPFREWPHCGRGLATEKKPKEQRDE